jgi:SAM-dependent methyltransferase
MNFNRIYEYRFKDVDQQKKNIIWKEIAAWLWRDHLKSPASILDPAGGLCEFINQVPATEKWTIDIEEQFIKKHADPAVRVIVGNNLEVPLPPGHFDAVFISNFLEHLNSQEEVARLLEKLHVSMKKGGRIAIMGPNFKYGYKYYFDFADHTVILTELGLAEHLYGAGFEIVKIYPQFLPISFRSSGILPVNRTTIRMYLKFPFFWRFFGHQFLVVAEKA